MYLNWFGEYKSSYCLFNLLIQLRSKELWFLHSSIIPSSNNKPQYLKFCILRRLIFAIFWHLQTRKYENTQTREKYHRLDSTGAFYTSRNECERPIRYPNLSVSTVMIFILRITLEHLEICGQKLAWDKKCKVSRFICGTGRPQFFVVV